MVRSEYVEISKIIPGGHWLLNSKDGHGKFSVLISIRISSLTFLTKERTCRYRSEVTFTCSRRIIWKIFYHLLYLSSRPVLPFVVPCDFISTIKSKHRKSSSSVAVMVVTANKLLRKNRFNPLFSNHKVKLVFVPNGAVWVLCPSVLLALLVATYCQSFCAAVDFSSRPPSVRCGCILFCRCLLLLDRMTDCFTGSLLAINITECFVMTPSIS